MAEILTADKEFFSISLSVHRALLENRARVLGDPTQQLAKRDLLHVLQ